MSLQEFIPTIQRLEKLMPELLQVCNNPSAQTKDKAKDQAKDKAKENCLKLLGSAVRRWVILRSLYDRDSDFFVEFDMEKFNCADWLNKFKQVKIDYQSVTLESWLFNDSTDYVKKELIRALKSRYNLVDKDINDLLEIQVFSVSERTFRNQFTQLANLKTPLLKRQVVNETSKAKKLIHNFCKLSIYDIIKFLTAENSSNNNTDTEGILEVFTNEVSEIAELLFTKIKGQQRLFIRHEYVVNEDLHEPSADLADWLKEIWKIAPTPPIKITYYSAYLNKKSKYVVYPVCLYYYQRAYYLCAYGQRPQRNEKQPSVGWYNYRLERVKSYKKLSWETTNLPFSQSEIINHPEQYSPDYIKEQLDSAYGFDFYEDAEVMLLRFDPDFAQRYIHKSSRHVTFEKLDSYEDAIDLIEEVEKCARSKILARIKKYPDAAYYTLRYRQNDNNVIMRIRAWGQKVEVLYPEKLRQRMREDIEQTWQLYQD